MRHLVFDEINSADMDKVRDHLEKHAIRAAIDDVYFVEFPENLLDAQQRDHGECQPYCFALETGKTWLKIELLVRSRNSLHCSCIKYANRKQMGFILEFGERLIEACNLRT